MRVTHPIGWKLPMRSVWGAHEGTHVLSAVNAPMRVAQYVRHVNRPGLA